MTKWRLLYDTHKWDKSRPSNLFLSVTAGLFCPKKRPYFLFECKFVREKSVYDAFFSGEALMSGCGDSYNTEGDFHLEKDFMICLYFYTNVDSILPKMRPSQIDLALAQDLLSD